MTLARARHVIHLTQDGLLQPIGHSQVMRVATGLAARGLPHTILSLERAVDLKDRPRVEALRSKLSAAGVTWACEVFVEGGGSVQFARNVASMTSLALRHGIEHRRFVVHARGFPVGPTALALGAVFGAPFLYDIRGFWVQRRAETALVHANPTSVRALRALDRLFYRRAAAMVSLTELGADIVRFGQLGEWDSKKPAVCIPTCADYEAFRLELRSVPPTLPPDVATRLSNRLVVGYVGSINADYRYLESVRLFARVLKRRPDALLLCLTGQAEPLRELAAREGIPESAILSANPEHRDMPAWLARIDWGLLLLTESFAKSASMPTKLGEFFAAGVRPIHFGCNAEVGDWVHRTGSGLSLPDMTEASLESAADAVAASTRDPDVLSLARERAREHFSIDTGLDRYEALIRRMASGD